MDLDEKAYRRKVISNHNSLIITIPHFLAYKMGIKKGHMLKATIDDDRLIFEHTEHNISKDDKKTTNKPKHSKKVKSTEDTESQAHHVVDLDDPNFNPINRLAL